MFERLSYNDSIDGIDKYLPKFKNLKYWFTDQTISDLLIIKYHLNTIKFSRPILNFLKVCFSKTIQEVSKGIFDGSSTHLKKNMQNFSPKVIDIFKNNVIKNLQILENIKQEVNIMYALAVPGDSRNILLKDNSIDCIITSPPYGDEENTIGYLRWTKFSLYWLGFTSDELHKFGKNTIGSKKVNKSFSESEFLSEFIKKLKKSDKRIDYLNSFFYDYNLCLKELFRVLKYDKFCCIVIGNRSIAKKPLLMDKITVEIALKIGFKLVNIYYRNIPTKAIPWSGISGKTIKKENIIILKKPNGQ